MSEETLWTWLSGLLPKGQYNRIESPDTAPGFPDVHYQFKTPERISGTIELKDSRHRQGIPFRNDKEGIHPSQFNWIKQNVAAGGIIWIVARFGPTVFWINGRWVAEFNGHPRLDKLASWVLEGRRITDEDTTAISEMLRGYKK